ncbi:polysaccharide biosynthesis tyrosine autokinase [Janibacter sp. GXQ6167]|uniref:polysaccharide biosynthesis tyrosine autokinase n=1 Tax=Janibacter sp. GXQ6167 TaxID=3240791 RepID=UPI003525BB13
MKLRDLVTSLRKRWLYVVIPVLLASFAVGLWSKASDPVYTARSSVYFSLPFGQSAMDLSQGATFTQQQVGSYAELAGQPIVLRKVIDDLKLDATPRELSRTVVARPLPDSVIVNIDAEGDSAQLAADISNQVAKELGEVVQDLSPKDEKGEPSVVVTQVATAQPPEFPSSPQTRRNVAAAAVGALLLGLILALGREALDTKVREEADLPSGTPVLGSVENGRSGHPSNTRRRGIPRRIGERDRAAETLARAEAFRRLRTKLRFIDVDHPVQVIAVTSSVAGEGKTSTAIDLARWIAADGLRVLLIDADLRRPRVAEYLTIEGAIGLTDYLAGDVPLDLAIQQWSSDHLAVLPSGSIPPNPSELLGSAAMTSLLDTLRNEYDLVLLDTPPLVPVVDGAVAGAAADGVLMVVRHGRTSKHQVAVALETLRSVDARLLGVVFNRTPNPNAWGRPAGYGVYETVRTDDS